MTQSNRARRPLACSALLLAAFSLMASQTTHAGPLRDWLASRHAQGASTPTDDNVPEDDDQPARIDQLPANSRVIKDIAYGSDPKQRYDVYLPAKPNNAPVVFMVHGGAWAIGDKRHSKVIENKIRHWVTQGTVLVSVNYRLVPDAAPLEQAQDVARALASAQQKAKEWGANPQRFVLMGHSAGAHLVGLISSQPDLAKQKGALPWLGSVMLDSAAMDVVSIMESKHHHRFYDKAFGNDPAYWRQTSPLHVLQPNTAPMLLVCSSKRDDSCPQAEAFAKAVTNNRAIASVLPENLSHSDINGELGLTNGYTKDVDQFLASLPGFRRP
ncbi:MAG: alpha/beta hydrolase [Aquabacterium sp.]|uniref:alpha/beta hydrolase n=1 Tax=Aquabacterium sp. TaxID=1872578 RepID=UPI003BE3B94C